MRNPSRLQKNADLIYCDGGFGHWILAKVISGALTLSLNPSGYPLQK